MSVKQVEVIIPATKEHVNTVTYVICDICEEKAVRRCDICKRDVCNKHSGRDPLDDISDCPSPWCTTCLTLFDNKYGKEHADITGKYESDIDTLMNNLKTESLTTK